MLLLAAALAWGVDVGLTVSPAVAGFGELAACQQGIDQAFSQQSWWPEGAHVSMAAAVVEYRVRRSEPPAFEVALEWSLGSPGAPPSYQVRTLGELGGAPSPEGVTAACSRAADSALAREALRSSLASLNPATQAAASWAPIRVRACHREPSPPPDGLPEAIRAVVTVRTDAGLGAGAVVSADGYVVTAAHVVTAGMPVRVNFIDGTSLTGLTVRSDVDHDVALLYVEANNLACLQVAPGTAEVGQPVFAVGAPAGLERSVSQGIVSALRGGDGWRLLQTDAALNPGNSGGPLLDADGRLAAVVSWKVAGSNFEGLGFGVPAATLIERLGIELGDESELDPHRFVATHATSSASSSVARLRDAPDSSTFRPDPDVAAHRRRMRSRREAGLVLAAVGGAVAAGSWVWARELDSAPDAAWYGLAAANVLGWSAVGGGAVLVGASFVPVSGGGGAYSVSVSRAF